MIHSFRFYQLKAGSRVLVAFEDVQGYLLSESGVWCLFSDDGTEAGIRFDRISRLYLRGHYQRLSEPEFAMKCCPALAATVAGMREMLSDSERLAYLRSVQREQPHDFAPLW